MSQAWFGDVTRWYVPPMSAAPNLDPIAALHPAFDADRQCLVLELDHGKANEMGTAQLEAFDALCDLVEANAEIRTVCTTSRRLSKRGKPIFIAGANVTERSDWDDTRVQAHVLRQRALMRRLRRLPVFNIVLASGVTLGWGLEYVLTGDYAIATAAAGFALPETGLGIVPGARGTAELAQLIGPAHALRLGCSGELISAEEAGRIGLVQETVADVDAGIERAFALATLVQRRSPTAVAAYKEALLDGLGATEDERLDAEARAYQLTVQAGEAAIGRENFSAVREGKTPPWGPRRRLDALER